MGRPGRRIVGYSQPDPVAANSSIGMPLATIGPKGGSANYWMTSEVASLFRKVRDGQ